MNQKKGMKLGQGEVRFFLFGRERWEELAGDQTEKPNKRLQLENREERIANPGAEEEPELHEAAGIAGGSHFL